MTKSTPFPPFSEADTPSMQWRQLQRRLASSWGVIEALPGACLVMDAEGTVLTVNTAWRTACPECIDGDNYIYYLRGLAVPGAAAEVDPRIQSMDDDDRLPIAAFLGAIGDLLEGRVAAAKGLMRLPMGPPRDLMPVLVHGAVHDGLALITHQDCTDLDRRAREAEETAGRYDLILSHLPVGLYMKDTRLRYLAINDAYSDIFGWQSDHVIGQTDRGLYDPDTASNLYDLDREILRNGKPYRQDLAITLQGRARIYDEEKRPLYDADGGVIGLLGVISDITEQRRLESELKRVENDHSVRRQKAEARVEDHILANLSHEIRTPMNALAGLAHVLEQTRLSERQRDVVKRLKTATHSLLGVLNDVLDVAALEAGRLTVNPAPVHLGDLFQGLEGALSPLAHDQGLSFMVNLAPDVPVAVEVDGLRLQQILVHLLGNAIKFTPQGEVSLNAELDWQNDDHPLIRFMVTDTGIGIADEQQHHLFELFHQVDTSLTRRYGGTGLGLALASRLVAMMGGKIEVISDVGNGSSFFFSLDLPTIADSHVIGELQTQDTHWRPIPCGSLEGEAMASKRVVDGFGAAIDVDEALGRLDGDLALLGELLTQFVETQSTAAQDILILLDQGDLHGASRQAHTLKGMAANLGAKGLATAAERVVRMTRAQDVEGALALWVGLRRNLQAVLREGEELVHRLSGTEHLHHSNYVGPLDAAALLPQLQSLQQMLERNSMAAPEAFIAVQDALHAVFKDGAIGKLGKAIHRLDYAEALEVLKQIVNTAEMAHGEPETPSV